jgi:hypothetical protein
VYGRRVKESPRVGVADGILFYFILAFVQNREAIERHGITPQDMLEIPTGSLPLSL